MKLHFMASLRLCVLESVCKYTFLGACEIPINYFLNCSVQNSYSLMITQNAQLLNGVAASLSILVSEDSLDFSR
jgi:hypothetical protein